MSEIAKDLLYTNSHEWVRKEEDGTLVIGISDHAQALLGDMVFVDLPEEGDELVTGEDFSGAESVKAASDIYAPVSGEVVAVNEALEDSPELINSEPYGDGWLVRIKPSDLSELENLLKPEAYEELLEEED